MDLTVAGRALFGRMIKIAGATPGTKLVTFALIDAVTYDPDTGTNAVQSTSYAVSCFLDTATDAETKDGAVQRDTIRLTLAADAMPRLPSTQDEATVDGLAYEVTQVTVDAMGVQMYVTVARK